MAQVTGIIRVKLNGTLLRTKQNTTLQTGGEERTVQKGHSVYGFSSSVRESTLSIVIAHTVDVDMDELRDLVDGVVLIETDTGATFQMNGAFTSVPPELSDGEGDLSVEITGQPTITL